MGSALLSTHGPRAGRPGKETRPIPALRGEGARREARADTETGQRTMVSVAESKLRLRNQNQNQTQDRHCSVDLSGCKALEPGTGSVMDPRP
eukprot:2979607-Rhodomonas_salina.1